MIVATLAMLALVTPLRTAMQPGVRALLIQTLCGIVVYGALVLAFDIAGLRTALASLTPYIKKRTARGRS